MLIFDPTLFPLTQPHLRKLRLRAFLAGCLPLGMACSGGYLTDGDPMLSPADMTQTHRLAGMNSIGGADDLGRRWQYHLLKRFMLNIMAKGSDTAQQLLQMPLASAGFSLYTDVADKTHNVSATLVSTITAKPVPVPVLEGSTWVAAVQMRSRLRNLKIGCPEVTPTATE